ncbi:MAG TPA: helix-turn-helix transcriptional regulator [Albitalea sp.]
MDEAARNDRGACEKMHERRTASAPAEVPFLQSAAITPDPWEDELGTQSAGDFDEAVAALYEAAVHPQCWQSALSRVAAFSGTETFHFLRWDPMARSAPFNVHADCVSSSAIERYNSHYWSVDPRRRLVEALAVGEMAVCQRHFSDAFVSRSELFQDYLLPVIGQRYTWFARPLVAGSQEILLAMMRGEDRGPFSDDEIIRVQRVMPHLQRASRLWIDTEQLRESAAVGRQVADASGLALFGLDEACRVVHTNAQAEAMLRDGQHLLQRGAQLQAAHEPDAARLRETLADVVASRCPQRFAITSRSGEPHACFLTISTLPAGSPLRPKLGAAAVLVMARRPGRTSPLAPEELARLFGLTRAESALALALTNGKALDEYVAEAGVSMSTARTHLRAVFDKTYTRRQADLVRLLLLLPAAG